MLGQVALPCREAWWGNFHITPVLYKHPVVLARAGRTSGIRFHWPSAYALALPRAELLPLGNNHATIDATNWMSMYLGIATVH
jgi:hypothetical protein